ncbi:MAG: alpha/beta fold hydrolase [Planctomycetota bacterium]|nr:alpha/beta fold hydrolase [Planctomycetota bacterium]
MFARPLFRRSPLLAAAFFALALVFCARSSASDESKGELSSVSYEKNKLGNTVKIDDELPPYDYQIGNGLYATITALNALEDPKDFDDGKLKVSKIPGFKKDIEVRAAFHREPAPLVAVLLGLGSRSRSLMARVYMSYLYNAGYHVITFDSPFLPAFSDRSRHGVAGNLEAEATLCANIVEAAARSSQAKGLVTKVGLVGASYGGTLALNIAKLSKEHKVQLRVASVLAISPPVNMRTAAARLDKWWAEDRWNYKLSDLYSDLAGHKPVAPGEPIPFSDEEMRAGLAAVFRLDLKEVVNHNDSFYKLGLLPKESANDDQYRRDWAETWTFTKFIEQMTYPYWHKNGNVHSIDQLWDAGDLRQILPQCADNVHVVIAADDPLNDPSELTQLQSATPAGVLKVLPNGGHMGFLGTRWAKARIQKIFE